MPSVVCSLEQHIKCRKIFDKKEDWHFCLLIIIFNAILNDMNRYRLNDGVYFPCFICFWPIRWFPSNSVVAITLEAVWRCSLWLDILKHVIIKYLRVTKPSTPLFGERLLLVLCFSHWATHSNTTWTITLVFNICSNSNLCERRWRKLQFFHFLCAFA